MLPTSSQQPGTIPADAVLPGIADCADEPIHIPGSIQRHGFLLVLDDVAGRVTAASQNAQEFLNIPIKLLLGASLDTVLDREILGTLRALSLEGSTEGLVVYLGAFHLKGELFSIVTHRVGGRRILEFERLDRLVVPEIMNSVITNFVGQLNKIATTDELCQAITQQVAELTGFDRVLLYSFDEAGHGTVLSEHNNGNLPSYLGLRFPASDIPRQARYLYLLNTVRIIPDASYIPSPLVGLEGEATRELDLSQSVLRSVSPIHLEYMRNMGTMASMSISIVSEGRLWGLISGHHASPRTVPYLVRGASDMLTKIVGTQLASFENAARLKQLVHFHSIQRDLLTRMAAETNFSRALISSIDELREVVGAGGSAILLNDEIYRSGDTPDDEQIRRIVADLDENPELDVFSSRALSEDLSWASAIRKKASGLIAFRTSEVRRSYFLWFRPEVIETVRWAGEPVKHVDHTDHLHPRRSFAIWQELLTGQATPWSQVEIESARDFRTALMTITLKRAEEAAEMNEARFQQLTHALPALVWTAGDDGHLTYVNERWREQGLAPAGRWFEVSQIDVQDRARVEHAWTAAVTNDAFFEEEVRTLDREGHERWQLVRAVPFKIGRQRAGWVGTFTDTTDRRQREAALRMTEKLATTGRMTSVIAHEINNPLESITNLLFLLRGECPTESAALEYIGMAESELERISGITKQTLRWGRERIEQEELTSARPIFEDVLRLFAGKIRNRHVTVTTGGELDSTFIGVPGQIRQVIANLLSNAVDAVPVGGAVELEVQSHADRTSLIVQDNGCGISEEQRAQLFQPFFSTKGDLGNGLGLYISHEIVERHGGTLTVNSTPGQGTTITVELPRKRALAAS